MDSLISSSISETPKSTIALVQRTPKLRHNWCLAIIATQRRRHPQTRSFRPHHLRLPKSQKRLRHRSHFCASLGALWLRRRAPESLITVVNHPRCHADPARKRIVGIRSRPSSANNSSVESGLKSTPCLASVKSKPFPRTSISTGVS